MRERNLFLFRHLRTEYNRTGKIMGGTVDIEVENNKIDNDNLTKKVITVCDEFQIKSKDVVIVSSPLVRCFQTALKIRDIIDPQINLLKDSRLQETNMGDFAAKSASDLRAEYGDIIDLWMYDPENFTFPGGESYNDVRVRVNDIKISLLENYRDKRAIVVCSHVDIIKMFICEVNKKSFNTRRDFSIPNGSVSVISIDKDDELNVYGVNIYP